MYQDITLETCLNYLARLKGLNPSDAAARVEQMMKRFDLYDHRKKKVKELSKGMQQKAQLIITLVHDPQLIIIDEPFSALDPVNTQMVKDLLREERDKGKTIVMCSHQMHQVEELCDRLVLINRGKVMLYGKLDEIRRQYSGQEVVIHPLNELPSQIPGVSRIERDNSGYILHLTDQITPQLILKTLSNRALLWNASKWLCLPLMRFSFKWLLQAEKFHEQVLDCFRSRISAPCQTQALYPRFDFHSAFHGGYHGGEPLATALSEDTRPVGYIDQSGLFKDAQPLPPERSGLFMERVKLSLSRMKQMPATLWRPVRFKPSTSSSRIIFPPAMSS